MNKPYKKPWNSQYRKLIRQYHTAFPFYVADRVVGNSTNTLTMKGLQDFYDSAHPKVNI